MVLYIVILRSVRFFCNLCHSIVTKGEKEKLLTIEIFGVFLPFCMKLSLFSLRLDEFDDLISELKMVAFKKYSNFE